MRIARSLKQELSHKDRWRVEQMLAAQPDLQEHNRERDMDLFLHLFAPEDLIRVGDIASFASAAKSAEFCWGNVWGDEVIVSTAAVCWTAMTLLRGATSKEVMSRRQRCEAVLGRLRGAGIEIVMVVEDGGDGLECWIDPEPGSYPVPSRGRCPGGQNNKTGHVHRVLWAAPATRIGWADDEEILEVA
jgi:hypothetical protein